MIENLKYERARIGIMKRKEQHIIDRKKESLENRRSSEEIKKKQRLKKQKESYYSYGILKFLFIIAFHYK